MMWFCASDLAGLPGMPGTSRGVLMRAQSSAWTARPRTGRGRSGCEYLIADLPEVTQQAIAAQAAGTVPHAAQTARTDAQASHAAQAQACATAMARWGQQLERSGAFDPARNPRLDLFQRFETYHRLRGGAVWPAINEFCALWQAGQIEALPDTLSTYPTLPPKTLDKWYRSWRLQGVEALLERKPRKDKGHTKLMRDERLYGAFVAAMAEMHEPTARQVARVLAQEVAAEQIPSHRTLREWMREFKTNNKVALLKLKNPDGWRNRYMPAFGSRSEHITAVNEEWQLDSTIADAQQRVEIAFNLADRDTGEIRRHALVAAIDVFTRRACVLVSRTSSANAVKALVRQAMMAWGKPQRIKTDNGKDYTATDFDFALNALKIDHPLCTPFSPDQKPFIERFLGTLLHDLFPMLQGFVGHDVATRKAIESAKSFAQRFGDKGLELHMTPDQLQDVIDGWLTEYHARQHSELGCSPNEMAQRHTTHVLRVDERALDLFMLAVAGNGLRMVAKRGISLGNAWFAAPELAAVMGEQVYCRQDEADLGALHVFSLDGGYICRALDHTRLGLNRTELAAKARAIEHATVTPLLQSLKKAARRNLTDKAVAALHAERQDAAIERGENVTRLSPRVVLDSTPSVERFLASQASNTDTVRQAARAALEQQDNAPATVHRMDTARQRYSLWVRLQAGMRAGNQIAAREATWLRSYEGSAEFQAWHSMQAGEDPMPDQAAG